MGETWIPYINGVRATKGVGDQILKFQWGKQKGGGNFWLKFSWGEGDLGGNYGSAHSGFATQLPYEALHDLPVELYNTYWFKSGEWSCPLANSSKLALRYNWWKTYGYLGKVDEKSKLYMTKKSIQISSHNHSMYCQFHCKAAAKN